MNNNTKKTTKSVFSFQNKTFVLFVSCAREVYSTNTGHIVYYSVKIIANNLKILIEQTRIQINGKTQRRALAFVYISPCNSVHISIFEVIITYYNIVFRERNIVNILQALSRA